MVDGRTVPLARSVTRIGRMPGQHIVVDDPGVSRIHAEVRRSGDVYRVADAGSSNGTSVNGERVVEQALADGDVIRVGDTELTFVLGGEPVS